MISYRVHSCLAETGGKIPFLVVSLCGHQRVSIVMSGIDKHLAAASEFALTLDALYDLLQGNPLRIERGEGAIDLCPDGDQLVIQWANSKSVHRVWMAELALAWNMLSGKQSPPIAIRWNIQ